MAAMNDLSPQRRVHSAGRPDLVAYHDRIVQSTTTQHGPGYEAMLQVVCTKFRALNDAYVVYLRGGGRPGAQNRSRRWGEAEHAYNGALETAAAAFAIAYPKPDGAPPVTEVEALVEHRVGPLCTGWIDNTTGTLVHATDDNCPQHPDTEPEAAITP